MACLARTTPPQIRASPSPALRRAPLFKGQAVAVIGGGNSGVEATIDLAGVVAHVTLIEFDDPAPPPTRCCSASCSTSRQRRRRRECPHHRVVGDGSKGDGTGGTTTASRARATSSHGRAVRADRSSPSTEYCAVRSTRCAAEVVIDDRGATFGARRLRCTGDCTTVPFKRRSSSPSAPEPSEPVGVRPPHPYVGARGGPRLRLSRCRERPLDLRGPGFAHGPQTRWTSTAPGRDHRRRQMRRHDDEPDPSPDKSESVLSWASTLEPEAMQQAERTASMLFVVAARPHARRPRGQGSRSARHRHAGRDHPAAVGVDIGRGMAAVETRLTSHDLPDTSTRCTTGSVSRCRQASAAANGARRRRHDRRRARTGVS